MRVFCQSRRGHADTVKASPALRLHGHHGGVRWWVLGCRMVPRAGPTWLGAADSGSAQLYGAGAEPRAVSGQDTTPPAQSSWYKVTSLPERVSSRSGADGGDVRDHLDGCSSGIALPQTQAPAPRCCQAEPL